MEPAVNLSTMTMEGRMSNRSENREALDGLFHRLYSEFGRASGEAIIRSIVEELGGLRVSIPDINDLYREERDRRICASFTGDNYEELAIRNGLSWRQIRRIIESERSKNWRGK